MVVLPDRGATRMNATVADEIDQLRTLKTVALKIRYQQVFGEPSRSWNRQFLFRRIAWRVQALAEGDLSERAGRRALELAHDADWKVRPSRTFRNFSIEEPRRDHRLPEPGSILTRQYKGRSIVVRVLDDGFEWEQRCYATLSTLAFAVTNTRWNGFKFFRIAGDTLA
jgi:Protein of unknown function (DUF2924)